MVQTLLQGRNSQRANRIAFVKQSHFENIAVRELLSTVGWVGPASKNRGKMPLTQHSEMNAAHNENCR